MATAVANVSAEEHGRRLYRTIWRWHFYAGIFCIPLVIWLSITGSIYLFKPQIERWMDRPYNHLHLTGPRATPEQIARTAVIAVPGSTLHYYELPHLPWNYLPIGGAVVLLLGQLAVLAPARRAAEVPPVVATRAI